MSDLRVPLDPVLSAFGLSATVTRPAPNNTPIATTGVWLPTPLNETQPFGSDVRMMDPRKVLALPRDAIDSISRGATVEMAEERGGTVKTWVVDGVERAEADCWRVIVRQANA